MGLLDSLFQVVTKSFTHCSLPVSRRPTGWTTSWSSPVCSVQNGFLYLPLLTRPRTRPVLSNTVLLVGIPDFGLHLDHLFSLRSLLPREVPGGLLTSNPCWTLSRSTFLVPKVFLYPWFLRYSLFISEKGLGGPSHLWVRDSERYVCGAPVEMKVWKFRLGRRDGSL